MPATIKNSQRNCVIEAEFDIDGYGLKTLFESLDIDYENRTIIRRIVTPGGKSRAYVNDIPVQMNTLREIGSRLIDIHSQHQTLLLADNRFQTGIVDSVASHDGLLSRYKETFAALQQSERELNRLRQQAEANDRDREYLAFQSDELQKAKLKEGEQAELEAQQTELSHAAEIKDTLLWISQEMTGADENLLGRIKEIEVSLGRIARVYPQADAFYTRLHSAALDLKDMASEIASEGDRLEADPQRLESVSQRLDLIYSLQQKHKADSVEALLALQTDYEKRLAQIEGSRRPSKRCRSGSENYAQKPRSRPQKSPPDAKKPPRTSKNRSKRCSPNWECRPPNCVSRSRRPPNCDPTARTTSVFCSRPTATCLLSRSNG